MEEEIQSWASWPGLKIDRDVDENELDILIESHADMPEDLRDAVRQNWDDREGFDGIVPFLESIEDDKIMVSRFDEGGYRYVDSFHRDADWDPSELFDRYESKAGAINEHDLMHISTHAQIVTADSKTLLAPKINQDDQITNFSGFPRLDEDPVKIGQDGENKFLDIYGTLVDRLEPEIGEELVDHFSEVYATGVTYYGKPDLRGTDLNFLIKLDIEADEALKKFHPSEQFEESEIISRDFDAKDLSDLVQERSDEMSRYAIGCFFHNLKAFRGEEAAEQYLDAIGEDFSFSRTNRTDYFI